MLITFFSFTNLRDLGQKKVFDFIRLFLSYNDRLFIFYVGENKYKFLNKMCN